MSSSDTPGTDAALAALQNSLASYEQEKQSKQAMITNTVVVAPKNRFEAARKEKLDRRRGLLSGNTSSQVSSPSLSATATPRLGPAPTSAPVSQDEVKLQAMKTPVIHLLAIRPSKSEIIVEKTHVPREDLDAILQKVGKQVEGKWQLTDRSYRDLDVWNFQYPSQEDRQTAIDNAVKAFDRMRLGKEEKLWQILLPKEDRGKGIALSKLHLGGGQVNRGLTPHYQPSPIPHVDAASDSRVASGANTPRLCPSSTPQPNGSKGDVMKRLLSKDPKKARAAEEAKERKRKEREAAAAASDREGGRPAKKQATKKTTTNLNVKSAEFVHSSDEASGEEGEVKPRSSVENARPTTQPKAKATNSASPDSSENTAKPSKPPEKPAAKAKQTTATNPSMSSAVKPAKPTAAGKSTPQTSNSLSAPSSQQKSQRSPQKPDSRPNVPSPLGAARPRVASDVSNRDTVGVQRVRTGADTPKGLGITNGARKRQDTVTRTESMGESGIEKKINGQSSPDKQQKPTMNGTGTPTELTNGASHKDESGVKRKAEDSPSQQPEGAPATKHRKTDSTSSQSQKSHPGSVKSSSTARTSPDTGSASDSAASVMDTITFNQGVGLAQKFRDIYYPAYAKLMDEMEAKEAKGEQISKEEKDRIWKMHRRLEQYKREINIASEREGS